MRDSLIKKVEQSAGIGVCHRTHGDVGKHTSESDGKEEQRFELFPDRKVDH